MQKINVEIKNVKVASFSPSKHDVSFIVSFDDGKEKEITKTLEVGRGEDAAHEIIKDIRRVEVRLNAEFDGKAVLDNYINIIIKDEDKVIEKLTMFLKKVFEKINVIKNQSVADGYMQLINQVNSMRLDF